MSSAGSGTATWVVLDSADRVVLICEGADGREAAEDWCERGYRVVSIESLGVTAA